MKVKYIGSEKFSSEWTDYLIANKLYDVYSIDTEYGHERLWVIDEKGNPTSVTLSQGIWDRTSDGKGFWCELDRRDFPVFGMDWYFDGVNERSVKLPDYRIHPLKVLEVGRYILRYKSRTVFEGSRDECKEFAKTHASQSMKEQYPLSISESVENYRKQAAAVAEMRDIALQAYNYSSQPTLDLLMTELYWAGYKK